MKSAEAWKDRAVKLREAARATRDQVEQRTLMLLAEDCDEIAKHHRAANEATD